MKIGHALVFIVAFSIATEVNSATLSDSVPSLAAFTMPSKVVTYQLSYGDASAQLVWTVTLTPKGKDVGLPDAVGLAQPTEVVVVNSNYRIQTADEDVQNAYTALFQKIGTFAYIVKVDSLGRVLESDVDTRFTELSGKGADEAQSVAQVLVPTIVTTWISIVPEAANGDSGQWVDKRDWAAFKNERLVSVGSKSQTNRIYWSSSSEKETVYWLRCSDRQASSEFGDRETIDVTTTVEMHIGRELRCVTRSRRSATTTITAPGEQPKELTASCEATLVEAESDVKAR